jgi:exopolysaccharide production protein ExoQ
VLHSIHMPSLSVPRSTRASLFDYGFAVWALLLTADTYWLFRGDARDMLYAGESDPVMQLLLLGTYLVTALLVAWRGARAVHLAARAPLLWIFVGLALNSILWSTTPSVTLVRSVAFTGTTLLGLYLAVTFELREMLQLLAWLLGALALLSLIYIFARPEYGLYVDMRKVSWRGVFQHKNYLGRYMTLAAMVFLTLALHGRHRMLYWAGFVLSVVLVLGSDSKSSWLILIVLLLVAVGYPLLRLNLALTLPLACAAVIMLSSAAAWLWVNLYVVLDLLNRDVTLTGRGDLWAAVVEMIRQRPWLGYGYGAFWLGMDGPSSYIVMLINWDAPHAHNGFLDISLDVGLLGLAIFSMLLGSNIVRMLMLALRGKMTVRLFPLLFITFILLLSLVESRHLGRNSIFWVTFSALTLMCRQPQPEGTEQL